MHLPSSLGGNDYLHDDRTPSAKQKRPASFEMANTRKERTGESRRSLAASILNVVAARSYSILLLVFNLSVSQHERMPFKYDSGMTLGAIIALF